jgi:hypothetical protein
VFCDSNGFYGEQSTVLVNIVGPPTSSSPADLVILQGYIDRNITWTLTDHDGEGQYRVLRDAVVVINWKPWVNGSGINVSVNTGLAVGIHSYVIEFNNTHSLARSDTVQVTVDDIPLCIQAPSNLVAEQNSATRTLSWILADGIAAGTYTLYINGVPSATHINVAWTNNTPFTIVASTNITLGIYNYTLVFCDSNGFYGEQSTVLVTITAAGSNPDPFIKFITDNALILIIGAAGIVIVAAVVAAARRKKVAKTKVKQKQSKKLPETATFPIMDSRVQSPPKKKLPDVYMDSSPKQQVVQPAKIQPAATGPATPTTPTSPAGQAMPVVPAAAKFYCARCAKDYDIQDPNLATWYSCPVCTEMLTYVVNCTNCNKPIGLSKIDYDLLKSTGMMCSYCQYPLKL